MVDLGFVGPSRPANDYRLLSVTDGDTPNISMAIRMVSIDTPESKYGGSAATAQAALDRTRARLSDGTYDALPRELREYLIARITPDAAARHLAAGERAAQEHKKMVETRLANPDGTQRKLAVIATGELIEGNGRLLAYTAPWFTTLPPRDDPRRRTFNLDMVAQGWAVTFIIYPSLPPVDDLNLLLDEADHAWTRRLGVWSEFGEDLLVGYEYRACVKLGSARLTDPAKAVEQAYQRVCVDLRTLTEVGLYGYHAVPVQHRLWIWQDQLAQARQDLNLTARRTAPSGSGVRTRASPQ
ncbi:hypothetical protein GCM10022221_45630 [Actinocorallia aurea]